MGWKRKEILVCLAVIIVSGNAKPPAIFKEISKLTAKPATTETPKDNGGGIDNIRRMVHSLAQTVSEISGKVEKIESKLEQLSLMMAKSGANVDKILEAMNVITVGIGKVEAVLLDVVKGVETKPSTPTSTPVIEDQTFVGMTEPSTCQCYCGSSESKTEVSSTSSVCVDGVALVVSGNKTGEELEEERPEFGKPDEKWIQNFVSSPKIRVCRLTGRGVCVEGMLVYSLRYPAYEDSDMNSRYDDRGCHNFGSLAGNIKSVNTFGKCVRLFKGKDCADWSIAYYPGSGNQDRVLNSKLTEVYSYGPCLPEEFKDSAFEDEERKSVTKNVNNDQRNEHFPDLVAFANSEKLARSKQPPGQSHLSYFLGPKKRVEFLSAHIGSQGLTPSTKGQSGMVNVTHYASLEKKPGDSIGYGIPLAFGGPPEAFNMFPQSVCSKGKWEEVTAEIGPFAEYEGNSVDLYVNFMYENLLQTRPYALYYLISYNDYSEKKRIVYGRVLN